MNALAAAAGALARAASNRKRLLVRARGALALAFIVLSAAMAGCTDQPSVHVPVVVPYCDEHAPETLYAFHANGFRSGHVAAEKTADKAVERGWHNVTIHEAHHPERDHVQGWVVLADCPEARA